jgi:Putative restriction endonuclease
MSDLALAYVSEDEYVAFELAADTKHEFVDGVVRAMTGASIRHNRVALNLAVALRGAAGDGPCEVSIEGVRLRINAKRHYYPDVMVCCDEPDDPIPRAPHVWLPKCCRQRHQRLIAARNESCTWRYLRFDICSLSTLRPNRSIMFGGPALTMAGDSSLAYPALNCTSHAQQYVNLASTRSLRR